MERKTLRMITTPDQAWALLQRHADNDVRSLRLTELCQEEDRVTSMVAVHNSTVDLEDGNDNDDGGHLLLVDFSRQRMTLETINHLLRLATARQLKDRIRDLSWGRLAPGSKHRQNNNKNDNSTGEHYEEGLGSAPTVSFAHDLEDRNHRQHHNNHQRMWGNQSDTIDEGDMLDEEHESSGSMHLALRTPANKGLSMRCPYTSRDPKVNNSHPMHDSRSKSRPDLFNSTYQTNQSNNALDEIHQEWKRIQSLTTSLRQGKIRGTSGLPLCDVLVVSVGGTVVPTALDFLYNALMQNEVAGRTAMVDSSLISSAHSEGGMGLGGSGSGTQQSSKNNVESMASSFQSGVINMVTTPFKSSRSKSTQDLHGNTPSSFVLPSNSSSTTTSRRRKLKFLTSIDPCAFREAVSDLSPATTMVITLSIDLEREKECKEVTMAVRSWLLSGLTGASDAVTGSTSNTANAGAPRAHTDDVVRMHMFLVTGKESMKKTNPKNVFLVPRHSRCEAFSTFSAAGLLPLSLIFGWNIVNSLILGAHDIDRHFVETNPRHNLPIILAMTDIWNDGFLHSKGRVMSPFSQAFGSYPRFVAALEDKVLTGGSKGSAHARPKRAATGNRRKEGFGTLSSPVFDGGANEIYDSSLYQGRHKLSSEFIAILDPQLSPLTPDAILKNRDERICSMFAYADTLAFGDGSSPNSVKGRYPPSNDLPRAGFDSPGSPPLIYSVDSMQSVGSFGGGNGADIATTQGNRPSTLVICGTCDAFACGQLLALAEHRVLVKAWLCNVDAFAMPKKQSIRKEQAEYLRDRLDDMYHLLSLGEDLEEDADNENNINLATKTILQHYAKRMHKYTRHVNKTPMRPSHNRFSEDGYY